MNGQRETANAFLVNGGDVSEGRNLGAGLIPNLDSIDEFRLITNSFDAEYGKFSGAVMNAITKSGTQRFPWRCVRISAQRRPWTRAISSIPRKAELRRNQFGYTAGGPFLEEQAVLVHRLSGHAAGARREHRNRAVADRGGTRGQLRSSGICAAGNAVTVRLLLGASSDPAPGLRGRERRTVQLCRMHAAPRTACFPTA